MSKFIIEDYKDGYIMSYIDDYIPPMSTAECKSIDECVYEMECAFKYRIKKLGHEMSESMKEIKSLCECKKLPIDMIGINLIDSDVIKSKITDDFMNIANEYMEFMENS